MSVFMFGKVTIELGQAVACAMGHLMSRIDDHAMASSNSQIEPAKQMDNALQIMNTFTHSLPRVS